MILADAAEQSLKGGDPAAALAHLQEQVRAKPADSRHRNFHRRYADCQPGFVVDNGEQREQNLWRYVCVRHDYAIY